MDINELPHDSLNRAGTYSPQARNAIRGRHRRIGGVAEHSDFAFDVLDHGELIHLDPWILFWQMYQDQATEGNLNS